MWCMGLPVSAAGMAVLHLLRFHRQVLDCVPQSWCRNETAVLSCRPRRIELSPEGSSHRYIESCEPGDLAMQTVAALDRANARRRAGEDQIAGRQHKELRQFGNDIGDGPDHIGEITRLAALAIHIERDRAFDEEA